MFEITSMEECVYVAIASMLLGVAFILLLDLVLVWLRERRSKAYWTTAVRLLTDDELRALVATPPGRERALFLFVQDQKHEAVWDELRRRENKYFNEQIDKMQNWGNDYDDALDAQRYHAAGPIE